MVCEKNALVERDGRVVAVGTGVTETIPAGAVFKSIGYTAVPVEGVRGRLVILVCCLLASAPEISECAVGVIVG